MSLKVGNADSTIRIFGCVSIPINVCFASFYSKNIFLTDKLPLKVKKWLRLMVFLLYFSISIEDILPVIQGNNLLDFDLSTFWNIFIIYPFLVVQMTSWFSIIPIIILQFLTKKWKNIAEKEARLKNIEKEMKFIPKDEERENFLIEFSKAKKENKQNETNGVTVNTSHERLSTLAIEEEKSNLVENKQFETKNFNKNKKEIYCFQIFSIIALLLPVIVFIYSGYVQIQTANHMEIQNVPINIKNLSSEINGFSIVHLTDIHCGIFTKDDDIIKAQNIISKLDPSIIVITGDIIDRTWGVGRKCLESFSVLKAKQGVYVVFGNHDTKQSTELTKLLESANITILNNEKIQLNTTNSNKIFLQGITHGYDISNYDKLFNNIEHPNVLLVHDPKVFNIVLKQDVDLTLAGHTHGLQGLSFLFNDVQSRGLQINEDHSLYINSGLGHGWPFRFNCPREITYLVLNSK